MNRLFGIYWTKKLNDIWTNDEDFFQAWNELAPFRGCFSNEEDSIKRIYLLLLAKYGNSTIANFDENQFRLKMFSTIFQYGPSWEKKLEYQSALRALTLDELRDGTKNIQNHSYNPSTQPSTGSLDELETIDNQNTNNIKKGKLEAIVQAASYLEEDFTRDFLEKFKKLFLIIVEPQEPLLYGDDSE